LKDLKELNLVQVAKYTVLSKVADKPAFVWWVKDVLRQRDRIISKVKTRYWKNTNQYGIELPNDAKHALEIDVETGTNFWAKSLSKEMTLVQPSTSWMKLRLSPLDTKRYDATSYLTSR
jgi:hypothetical protein